MHCDVGGHDGCRCDGLADQYVMGATIGMNARGALTVAVFNKAMKLSEPAYQRIGIGKVVNLVQIDCMKFSWAACAFHCSSVPMSCLP